MRVAIVTLPLHTNYGGLLQAYALKSCLESFGHDVTVLDLQEKMPVPKGLRALVKYAGRAFKRLVKGKNGPEVFRELRYRREFPTLSAATEEFVRKYIEPRVISSYSDVKEGEYDAFVVGSDQVWRPRFFNKIEDAFLAFTKDWDVRRVAYAASFGTDQLEYEFIQLEECARLLDRFDGVSVREDSAVGMCEEWFDYEGAFHVLDPVMLPATDVYMDMLSEVKEHPAKGRIVTYILDPSAEKDNVVSFIKRVSGLEIHDVSVNPYASDKPLAERVVPPLEGWLAAFHDADFVVTDSFHGCVLSIMMRKRFVAVGNSRRGMARLSSLLNIFGLDMRLVHGIDPEDDGGFFLSEIEWDHVGEVLQRERVKSKAFLSEALGNKDK